MQTVLKRSKTLKQLGFLLILKKKQLLLAFFTEKLSGQLVKAAGPKV